MQDCRSADARIRTSRLICPALQLAQSLIPWRITARHAGKKKPQPKGCGSFNQPGCSQPSRALEQPVGLSLAVSAFEGQWHGAEIAFGLNQHQRRFLRDDRRWTLTRHLHRLDFSGHGHLCLSDFGGV